MGVGEGGMGALDGEEDRVGLCRRDGLKYGLDWHSPKGLGCDRAGAREESGHAEPRASRAVDARVRG